MTSKSAPASLQTRSSQIDKKEIRISIRNASQLTSYHSELVSVNNVPFKVRLVRDGENVLVELYCLHHSVTTEWSCAARTILRLLSFAACKYSNVYEKRQDAAAVFSSELSAVKCNSELIKWNDLFDSKRQHIINDTFVVDVHIQAEQLRDSSHRKLLEIERHTYGQSVIRFKLAKVRGVIATKSSKFMFRDTPCELVIAKRYPLTKKEMDQHKYGYLGIWLYSDKFDTSKYRIQVTLRLLSHRPDGKHIEKFADIIITSQRLNFTQRLIPLHELYQNPQDYVRNDSLTLEVIMSDISDDECAASRSRLNDSDKTIVMECILCYENLIDRPTSSTPCGHIYCRECIIESLKVRATCPICNKGVVVEDVHDVFLPTIRQIQ